jgi:hypothetical protein
MKLSCGRGNPMLRPALWRVLLSGLCAIALSGCILDRLWETHRQFYGKDPLIRVKRQLGTATCIAFLQPTLLERDIEWLLDEKPSSVEQVGDSKVVHYTLIQEGRPIPAKPSLVFCVHYIRRDQEFRLAEIVLPSAVETLLTPQLVEALAKALEVPETDLLRRRVRLDLHALQKIKLPRRSEVEALLGTPNQVTADGEVLYRFYLLRGDRTLPDKERVFEASITFDDGTQRIRNIRGRYHRYQVSADVSAAEATVQVQ